MTPCIVHNYYFAPAGWLDADARSFIVRTGITDANQVEAINALVLAAKANGWWDLCDLIYPFVGGTAAAHAQNLKTSLFPITWNGAITHNANGVTGDGATGYGATGYTIPGGNLDSIHAGAYFRSSVTAGQNSIGGSDASNGFSFGQGNAAARRMARLNDAAQTVFSQACLLRLSAATRLDAVNKHGYRSMGLSGPEFTDQAVAVASVAVPTVEMYVLARNNNGAAAEFTTANLAGLTLGTGLSFAIFQLMAADWHNFNTAVGRQV